MTHELTLLLNSVVYTSLLVLMALGLALIFGLGRVVNFAHAMFYAAGAYVAWQVIETTGSFWLALLAAPVVLGVVAILLEVGLIRRIRNQPELATLLLTFGMSLAMLGVIDAIWGPNPRSIHPPEILTGTVDIFGAPFPIYRLFVVVVAVALTSGLLYLVYGTKWGTTIRAINDDPEMATVLGVNSALVLTGVFGLGVALAAMAGALSGPVVSLFPTMGDSLLIESFVVLILGGLGSLRGALIASAIVGVVRTMLGGYIADYAMLVLFVLVAVVLLVRPRGILGEGRIA